MAEFVDILLYAAFSIASLFFSADVKEMQMTFLQGGSPETVILRKVPIGFSIHYPSRDTQEKEIGSIFQRPGTDVLHVLFTRSNRSFDLSALKKSLQPFEQKAEQTIQFGSDFIVKLQGTNEQISFQVGQGDSLDSRVFTLKIPSKKPQKNIEQIPKKTAPKSIPSKSPEKTPEKSTKTSAGCSVSLPSGKNSPPNGPSIFFLLAGIVLFARIRLFS